MGERTFYTTKMSFLQSGTMSILPWGLTHDFLQKFEISSEYHFLWKLPKHDVNNVLSEKKRFPWLQKFHFNIVGKCPLFPKGLAHDFPQEFENSSQSHFLWKITTQDF